MRATMRFAACVAAAMIVAGLMGCSASGAGMTAFRVGSNLSKKDSYLSIWLDGKAGAQDTAKKAMTGYSEWKVAEQVNSAPKVKYVVDDPAKFGRITMVAVSIFQKFEADYSHQAEFTVVSRSNDSTAQMKSGEEYDLGNPGPDFKVINVESKEVPGVALIPGKKYMLTLTVKADHSETAQVYFEAK